MTWRILPGRPFPLGATVTPTGVNFSVFSKNCTALELLLFEHPTAPRPAQQFLLDPHRHKSFYYWHAFVPGLKAGQLYAYRAHGPLDPAQGHRFDGAKVLVDPYARAVTLDVYDRAAAGRPGDNSAHCVRSVVVDPTAYDWEGDIPLRHPLASTVIYEMHVRGFTRHPNSGLPTHQRGTYAGLQAKIPYLQALGITAVELLPVQQFDAQDVAPPRTNYWGYNPLAFCAPHAAYSSDQTPLGPVNEFRDLVKALHRAGIEVILDVVFNHTAEGDASGPTLSWRGLENRAYYLLDENHRANYLNYTGCGNTLNGNQAIVRRLIIDCLRYWVQEMHVDGFRFDLASVFSRDETGRPVGSPPIVWDIESDPALAETKLIAEAWDAAGLYQVGSFVGDRWGEWNGQYRDDVRRWVKSDAHTVERLQARLLGSPDLYEQQPNRSINFITAHDGFTLNDLVSYNTKHNAANGEQNRDGHNDNLSWNGGVEGPTTDAVIAALRERQIKNCFTLLMVSQGTPMLLMGDEVRRTQQGNNNAYCQDHEGNWFDWDAVPREAGLLRFVQELVRFNQARAILQEDMAEEAATAPRAANAWENGLQVIWHGCQPYQPDSSSHSHSLAFSLRETDGDDRLYVALNSYWEPLDFTPPPPPPGLTWHRLLDTALPSPHDYVGPGDEVPLQTRSYRVTERACVVLIAMGARG